MNKNLFVSLSLTSSSSDDEMSSLVHKLFLKTLFVVLLPLYVFFYLSNLHHLSFSYEDIC